MFNKKRAIQLILIFVLTLIALDTIVTLLLLAVIHAAS